MRKTVLAIAVLGACIASAQAQETKVGIGTSGWTTDKHFNRMRPSIGPWKSPHPT